MYALQMTKEWLHAASEGGLQKLMDGLNRTAKENDMKVNIIKKTKVMEKEKV